MQYQYTAAPDQRGGLRRRRRDSRDGDRLSHREPSRRRASALQGREQTYVLPPLTHARRVARAGQRTPHPRSAACRRSARSPAREFRARLLRIVALSLFGIAALTLLLALVRWVRQNRRAVCRDATGSCSPIASCSAACGASCARSSSRRARGWTPDHVRQALTSTRIVASYLAGHPVAQRASANRRRPASWRCRRLASRVGAVAVAGSTTPRWRLRQVDRLGRGHRPARCADWR